MSFRPWSSSSNSKLLVVLLVVVGITYSGSWICKDAGLNTFQQIWAIVATIYLVRVTNWFNEFAEHLFVTVAFHAWLPAYRCWILQGLHLDLAHQPNPCTGTAPGTTTHPPCIISLDCVTHHVCIRSILNVRGVELISLYTALLGVVSIFLVSKGGSCWIFCKCAGWWMFRSDPNFSCISTVPNIIS